MSGSGIWVCIRHDRKGTKEPVVDLPEWYPNIYNEPLLLGEITSHVATGLKDQSALMGCKILWHGICPYLTPQRTEVAYKAQQQPTLLPSPIHTLSSLRQRNQLIFECLFKQPACLAPRIIRKFVPFQSRQQHISNAQHLGIWLWYSSIEYFLSSPTLVICPVDLQPCETTFVYSLKCLQVSVCC